MWQRGRCRTGFIRFIHRDPPPRILLLLQVLTGIALGVHTCACIFWLCKVLSHPEEEVFKFMEEFEINTDVKVQYTASFYFITTIITTIGFGDITPYNTAERIFCIIVMILGSLIFGILLAEVQQVVHQASQVLSSDVNCMTITMRACARTCINAVAQ